MKNIAIFCSASDVDDTYKKAATEFASLLGTHHFNLVWGASDKGLMNIVADAAQSSGSKLTGITVPHLKEAARKSIDELIVASTLYERKAKFLELSDAFVTLVGGIGTLDEILEITELKKHHLHNKPIVILNTAHFYDLFIKQMQQMETEGFFSRPLSELIHFSSEPQEAIEYVSKLLG